MKADAAEKVVALRAAVADPNISLAVMTERLEGLQQVLFAIGAAVYEQGSSASAAPATPSAPPVAPTAPTAPAAPAAPTAPQQVASNGAAPTADPFAESDPFAAPASDPFAAPAAAPKSNDPFAMDGDDPFDMDATLTADYEAVD
jgi:molecular chaperone DnaK